MKTRWLLFLWMGGVLSLAAAPVQEDPICQQLWDAYLARSFKVNTATKNAAIHIVAERGRNNGFWRVVLGELKRRDQQNEANCVTVLGQMLAVDAAARYQVQRQQETGEVSAWLAKTRREAEG